MTENHEQRKSLASRQRERNDILNIGRTDLRAAFLIRSDGSQKLNDIYKMPQEKTYQPKIMLLVKISLRDEGERKPFVKEENRISHQQTSSPKTYKRNFFGLKKMSPEFT